MFCSSPYPLSISYCFALIIDDAASRCPDWDWDHWATLPIWNAVTALRHPHVPPRPCPTLLGIDHPITGTRHGSWETWNQIVSSHHDTGLSIFEDNSCIGNSHKFDGKQICISESVIGACFHLHLPPIISVTKSHDNYVTKLPNVQCGNYFLIISIIV